MKVSVVICTRNRPDLIGTAVASVLANTHASFDLIIIDQSDTDATRVAITPIVEGRANVRYVHTTRVGLSAAYNTAISNSTGSIIAFTDDDCVAPPNWLESIEREFSDNPDVDLMYGEVRHPASLRRVDGVVPTLTFGRARKISSKHGFQVIGMGANFAARRDLFRRIGPFDEVLGGGGALRSSQDFDLQYRVYRNNLVTYLSPRVWVDHYGLRTYHEWPKTIVAYGIGNGGFFMKHMRCGDITAGVILVKNLTDNVARQLVKAAIGRPHSFVYARGVLSGLRLSFNFKIDRANRLYVLN